MQKLRECPFCGATPHPWTSKPIEYANGGGTYQNYGFICPHKCAHIYHSNVEVAAGKWNTRASDKMLELALKEIKSAIGLLNCTRLHDLPDDHRYYKTIEAIEQHLGKS